MNEYQYDVFISHNSKDKPAVEWLAKKMIDQVDLTVFLDIWNLVPGDPWQEDLENALEASRTVAVFLGPAGISGWHNEELRNALSTRVSDRGRRVIPILLPGTTMPEDNEIPSFLQRLTWVDFQKGLEDEEAFHRLVAGIKGEAPGRLGKPGEHPPPKTVRKTKDKEMQMSEKKVDTGGGAYIGGKVNTGGGDFVGRDKNVAAGERSVSIGGNVTGSTIITGDNNLVQTGGDVTLEQFTDLIKQMSDLLPKVDLPKDDKSEIQEDLARVQSEAEKPEPNKRILLKRLGSVVEFLANTATVVTAAPQLVEMGQKALEWAKLLF